MTQTTLIITGMTCDHCKAAVEKALKKIPGVQTIVVDRIAGSAAIEWDESKSSREQLVAAVNELGYIAQ